jgi:drug/metabolite transporter (DMT)-like permease
MTLVGGLRLKTYLLISLMVLFGPMGDVLLSKGMKRVGPLSSWAPAYILRFFQATFASSIIWLGIGSLFTFFIAYMLVLSWADFSYVQPPSSMAYAVVAFLGYVVLREAVSTLRWVGIAIICAGVFIVGHTSPRTTEC